MKIFKETIIDSFFKNEEASHSAIASFLAKKSYEYNYSTEMTFFPEYTDHSILHNLEIAKTSLDIISDQSLKILSSNDKLFLIASIFMHDFGMHITGQIFQFIINSSDWKSVEFFDQRSWNELWTDYMIEAKRWDSRKLILIFGDSEPIEEPDLSNLDLNQKNRLLIGEFIRRNHGRLAHELSLNGLPTFSSEEVKFIDVLPGLSSIEKDLVGLIARSHTLDLRACFSYIESHFHMREFQSTHIVYIMVLLRISDYLQVQAERAPKKVTETRKIQSPYSKIEWQLHQCVYNITQAESDPEAIFIDLRPSSVEIFLRIENWLRGLQSELDKSWALLGEVYGRFDDLNKLGIKLRRVKSNIDNLDEFSKKINYIPKKISFDSSNPDLLKLLIDPLYGDDPIYGIRELIQNSVDAVLERDEILSNYEIDELDFINQSADVEIKILLNNKRIPHKLVISDKGIGMTAETINNYFLKAGASFRKSLVWKRNFENEQGESKILRSGRFGIGVLACFLVGERVNVQTRHVFSSKGVHFSATVDSNSIQLEKSTCKIGTSIEIEFDKKSINRITGLISDYLKKYDNEDFIIHRYRRQDWDWFCLKYPLVKTLILPQEIELPQYNFLPSENDSSDQWYKFDVPGYKKIFWKYDFKSPDLVCNGIMIKPHSYSKDIIGSFDGFRFEQPKVSVFDPNGYLPLNLSRNNLRTKELPFSKILFKEIIKTFVNELKRDMPGDFYKSINYLKKVHFLDSGVSHQNSRSSYVEYGPLIALKKGVTLFTKNLISKTNLESILIIPIEDSIEAFDLSEKNGIANLEYNENYATQELIRFCIDTQSSYSEKYGLFSGFNIKGRLSIIPQKIYESNLKVEYRTSKFSIRIRKKIKLLNTYQDYALIGIDDYKVDNNLLISIFNEGSFAKKDNFFASQMFLYRNFETNPTILDESWLNYFEDGIMPYSKELRFSN